MDGEGERMPSLKPETREKLRTVSVATLCTALFKRGLRNQFIQDVRPLNPDAGTMVGEAFTLRYNSHTHQAWVCQTAPYSGGASLSYLYGAEGMEEVARCTDQTPMPQPKPIADEGGDGPEAPAPEASPEPPHH